MILNTQYIEKLSSEAFWSFVFENGWKATGFPENIEDIPKKLWSREIVIKMLISGNAVTYKELSDNLINRIYYAVAETIVDHVKRGENIIGMIFQEDFKSCKDPNFLFPDMLFQQSSDSDQNAKYKINLKGNYENRGDLLLRTPFPSGVLLKSEPHSFQILIADTFKALGFQKTLLLPVTRVSTLPPNEYGYKYFATGTFHIPTVSEYDALWLKLIPNAIAILGGFTFRSGNGEVSTGEIVSKSNSKNESVFKKLTSLFQ
jgi:hypothetical protein